jgi:hypothetical protein
MSNQELAGLPNGLAAHRAAPGERFVRREERMIRREPRPPLSISTAHRRYTAGTREVQLGNVLVVPSCGRSHLVFLLSLYPRRWPFPGHGCSTFARQSEHS